MQNDFVRKRENYRKILSWYVVMLLLVASLIAMTQRAESSQDLDVVITTYSFEGGLSECSEFGDDQMVIVNISADGVTNDPESPPFYYVLVTNSNTSEWCKVTVFDNDTGSPLDDVNEPSDGEYWGTFNISSSNETINGSYPIIQVSNGDIVNISEDPSSGLDGDGDVAYQLVTANFSSSGNNNITISGCVTDAYTGEILNSSTGTTIMIMPMDDNGGGGDQPMGEDETLDGGGDPPPGDDDDDDGGDMGGPIMVETYDNGSFEKDVTDRGPGEYEVMVMRDGYVGYINWSLDLNEGDSVFLDIRLDEQFEAANYSHIKGNVTNVTIDGQPTPLAQIILLDTNVNHMWDDSGGMPQAYTNATGQFSFNISYRSNYTLIAYKAGYYSQISNSIWINDPSITKWNDFALIEAEPDTLIMTVEFTDLDDAVVTLNRTIVASSPLVRFGIDFNPEAGGNNNQQVSQTEINSYLELIGEDGPMMNVSALSMDESEESEEGEEGGGPGFLATPISIEFDGSNFDSYLAGSYNGTLENIVNTTVSDNSTIFYNATFNLTLDGPILNQTTHTLKYTTFFNSTLESDVTFNFVDLYNFSSVTDNDTNASIYNNVNTLTIGPGSGPTTGYAYANISLELNGSTVTLPIIEVPTLNKKDKWVFKETSPGSPTETVTYTVEGKAFRSKDTRMYTKGDENESYVCYEVMKHNNTGTNTYWVTVNGLNWLVIPDNEISYVINDIDFPLYAGKTWYPYSWWGDPVNATIVSCSDSKVTEDGTYSCVKVNYLNASNHTDLVGQEWYSPDLHFFVNRTQYQNSQQVSTLNMSGYSLAPYIESVTIFANDSDADSLINSLDLNVTINASRYYAGPTDFGIEGPVYTRSGHDWNDITYVHVEDSLRDFGTEIKTITIPIAGSLINAEQVDGPYCVELYLKTFEGWYGVDYDVAQLTTAEYSWEQFESPSVSIYSVDAVGNDTSGDGKYDYLTVNVSLNVTEGGQYSVEGSLDYVIDYGMWEDWRWITGTHTEIGTVASDTNLTIKLNFPGSEIYDGGYDGTYKLHIEIKDDVNNTRIIQNESTAGIFYHTDFTTPSIYFNQSEMEQDGQQDYINNSAYLTVNASVAVEAGTFGGGSGSYELCGGLNVPEAGNSWGYWIAGACNDFVILYEGDNIVPLNFDLGEITDNVNQYNSSYNGSFTVNMDLREKIDNWVGSQVDYCQYTTSAFSLDDLPAAPITLGVNSDDITNDGNTLRVNATINVSSDQYANDTYDIHGGVHYRVGSGEDSYLNYITGTGEYIYLNYGQNDVCLNFSGQAISDSGQNGPYPIWMGLEDMTTHNMIVSDDDYETAAYSINDFVSPAVQFNASAITTSLDDSGEYFIVNASIIVNTPGTYHIGGGINGITRGSHWDGEFFLAGTGNDHVLSGDDTFVLLYFEQSLIKNSMPDDYNDVLRLHLGIENTSTWQQIVHLTYDTSQSYTSNDFSSAGVSILSASEDISDYNIIVNLSYNATSTETYIVDGGLQTFNWQWITGVYEQTSFQQGDRYLELTFSGNDIFNNMQNGPYKVWIGIRNVTTGNLLANVEITTGSYSYNQFSGAFSGLRIERGNMSAGTCDYMNSTGSETYLTINVTINATAAAAGTYQMDGNVNSVENNCWEWITGTGGYVTIHEGLNVVPLNFRAGDIYSSGKDGPYRVWIGIRNTTTWTDEDNYEYTTQAYTSSSLPPPPIAFGTMTYGTIDYLNTTGTTNYITINVTLDVDAGYADTYELHGGIHYIDDYGGWYHLTHAHEWVTLPEGSSTIPLNFNAGEIKSNLPDGYNDNLTVWIGLQNVTTWNEISNKEYETQEYSKAVLPDPAISINDSATNEYVNDSYLTVNLTIDVGSGYQGEYQIHGGIHYIDTSQGWDDWRFITGTGSMETLSTGEQVVPLNFNGGEVYSKLDEIGYSGKLAVWAGVQNASTWEEITNTDYETTATYSSASFNPPSITVSCLDAYINNTGGDGQYLTVNISVNATGDSLDQAYDLHGGIHYVDTTYGWQEWRYITGAGVFIENLTENRTIALNFPGSAIRSTEEDGPYEIWVGINSQDSWEPLSRDEYTTDPYSYTSFSEPVVRLISNSFTDFANDTTGDESAEYLTINVTLNASNAAVGNNYFLEGGLHWQNGMQWRWITWSGEDIEISSDGLLTLPLNFDAKQIANAENDGWSGGALVAWVSLRNTTNWNELSRVDEYTTQNSYLPSDFLAIPITFNRSASLVENQYNSSGGSSPYDLLNLTVELNVTMESDDYSVYASLYDSENKTFIAIRNNSGNVGIGDNNVTLLFDGSKIYKKHYSGTFELRAKIINTTDWFEYDSILLYTDSYNYDDFTPADPDATIVGITSNFTNGNGDLVVNVTININRTDVFYELYGDLFDSTGLTYITNSRNDTFDNSSTGDVTVSLVFDNSDIGSNTAPYVLSYLRLSVWNSDTWDEIDTKLIGAGTKYINPLGGG